MGELPDDSKLELLWRDYNSRMEKHGEPKSIVGGLSDRALLYILGGAMALGMGPETASKLLNIVVGK